ncbi:carbohydrate kinase [Methylocapsa sp. S129]|uniref:carbohydrate kinase family protein n=1 Tax=Methylocapsa sp. S129 TaxID=1641869 RepID=UPI00131B1AB3|nr:carbohydrate kinase [Methylocapsa sp. S129]
MILISGEALIDLIPDADRKNGYDAVLGGSPFNVAIGLGRLGSPTAFVSRLSTDPNGESLAAALVEAGVDLTFVARDAKPSPLAFVMRGTAQSGARYSFYLDATAYDEAWPFPKVWPAGARHLHIGSFCAVDHMHGSSSAAALAMARTFATTSFDPNIRPMVTPDREAVVPIVEREVALASVVKASEEDLLWLYPDREAEASIAAWALLGPHFCVMTRGEQGAVAYLQDERLFAPSPIVAVVDTVGAGDSFMSALIAAMDADSALGVGARAPTSADLTKWLTFAVAASAITCTRQGSDPPTRAEVLAWLAKA